MKLSFVIAFLLTFQLVYCQHAEIIKFDQLKQIITSPSDKIQIINFWATWCAPCVKELPLFEKLNSTGKDVNVVLVNLDFAEKIDKVNSFIARKKLNAKVLLLDEIDYNSWIDQVDASWSGAIPATLIINPKTKKRIFIEKELEDGDLEKNINDVQ